MCLHMLPTGVQAFLLTTSYNLEQLEQCLVCDGAKIFDTSKFSSLNKTGTAYKWELLIANHLEQSFSIVGQSKTREQQSDPIY